MTPGTILQAARREASSTLTAGLVVAGLAAAVLAFNWKYVYNFVAGPFAIAEIDASAAAPAREFARAEGPLASTGWAQETTVRLFRGVVETKDTSARYLAMTTNGRILIVKAPVDFAGQVVNGRLVPLPEAIRTSLGGAAAYPWMLDAHIAYRWDFNIFVPAAVGLLALALVMSAVSAWRSGNVLRHPAIAALARFGDPLKVVNAIEHEIAAAGVAARVGSVAVSNGWIVAIDPSVKIVAIRDLIGICVETAMKKTGGRMTPQRAIRFWARARLLSDTIAVSEPEAQTVLDRIRAVAPWAVVGDPEAFDRRWKQDRAACERDADARRGGPAGHGRMPAPTPA
jgi:hypothetical protein